MFAVLSDDASLIKFSQFCEKKFCSENLTFWQAVQEFKTLDEIERKDKANALINEYIVNGAPLQINLDCAVVKRILANKEGSSVPTELFKDAENYVFTLMEMDVYPNFLKEQKRLEEQQVELEQEQLLSPRRSSTRKLSSGHLKDLKAFTIGIKSKSFGALPGRSSQHSSTATLITASSTTKLKPKQQQNLYQLSPEARTAFLYQQQMQQKEKERRQSKKKKK